MTIRDGSPKRRKQRQLSINYAHAAMGGLEVRPLAAETARDLAGDLFPGASDPYALFDVLGALLKSLGNQAAKGRLSRTEQTAVALQFARLAVQEAELPSDAPRVAPEKWSERYKPKRENAGAFFTRVYGASGALTSPQLRRLDIDLYRALLLFNKASPDKAVILKRRSEEKAEREEAFASLVPLQDMTSLHTIVVSRLNYQKAAQQKSNRLSTRPPT